MKTILLAVVTMILFGCNHAPPQANTNVQPVSNIHRDAAANYRKGMHDGAVVSTVVVGQTLCDVMKATASECIKLKNKMTQLAISSISSLPDSFINELERKDPTYRGALKHGSISFATAVGDAFCSATKSNESSCMELKSTIAVSIYQFVDSLTEEQLRKIKEAENSDDLMAGGNAPLAGGLDNYRDWFILFIWRYERKQNIWFGSF